MLWYIAGAVILGALLLVIFIDDIFPEPGMRWTKDEVKELRKGSKR